MPPETSKNSYPSQPLALIVGFNIHGLALARALSQQAIEVHALSAHPGMAANRTRFARVHIQSGINSDDLTSILVEFASSHLRNRRAVLFPTSDNMVRAIGQNWDVLKTWFLLSWSTCIDLTLELQSKSSIPKYCKRAGIAHPASITVHNKSDVGHAFREIRSPIMVKPVKPLSGFKALIIHDAAELESAIRSYANDLPFVAQQFIDGPNDGLYFCSMYLIDGIEQYAFAGRKLLASPPITGQGIIMTTEDCPEIIQMTRTFLRCLRLSGHVAIEYKRDSFGKYWLIEPNIGRTEYCVDLLIQSGVNAPLIEYMHVTKENHNVKRPSQTKNVTWYDTEKDPLCYIRHCIARRSMHSNVGRPVFPYFGHKDSRPLGKALQKAALSALKSLRQLLSSSARVSNRAHTLRQSRKPK